MKTRRTRWLLLLLSVMATVGCDRVTKQLASTKLSQGADHSYLANTLRLEYAENAGGFLRLGAGLPPRIRTAVFTAATGLALFAAAILTIRRRNDLQAALGLALFTAGGASNWVDRILHGRVIDFLSVGAGFLHTGIFNIADVAIMLGAAIYLLAELRKPRQTESCG